MRGLQTDKLLTCVLYPNGSSIVDCVLGIVDGGVVPDKVEVTLKLIEALVVVRVNPLPHRPKVHRLRYHIQIVRNLPEQEI